jgi:hypothetical protein
LPVSRPRRFTLVPRSILAPDIVATGPGGHVRGREGARTRSADCESAGSVSKSKWDLKFLTGNTADGGRTQAIRALTG